MDNTPQITNPVGRPLKFKSVEELSKKIEEYFEFCDNRAIKKADDSGKEFYISNPAPYTVHGLSYFLGTERQTLLNYSNKEKYFDTIKDAKERIASDVETRLMDGKAQVGAIFNLKNNFGWKDESKTQLTGDGGNPLIIRIISDTIDGNSIINSELSETAGDI